MKDFLRNHGLWILFAGAVIAVALALLSYFSTNASPLVDLANTITSPFRAVCTSVSGWFTDKQNYYEDVTALKAENEALKKQIAEMEATVRQGEAASQENVFLRDLLDLRQQRRDLSDFETATVTERGVTNWTASLTLNKGTAHGVEIGDCVIDGNGNLVGRISKAGHDWSTVLTVIDTDTSLGARVYRTKDIGIAGGGTLKGGGEGGNQGIEKGDNAPDGYTLEKSGLNNGPDQPGQSIQSPFKNRGAAGQQGESLPSVMVNER